MSADQESLQSSILQQSVECKQTVMDVETQQFSINEQNSTVVNKELEPARLVQAQDSALVTSNEISKSTDSQSLCKDSFDINKVDKSSSYSGNNEALPKVENSELQVKQSENVDKVILDKHEHISTVSAKSSSIDFTKKTLDIDDNLILQSLNARDNAVYNSIYTTIKTDEELSAVGSDISEESKNNCSSQNSDEQILLSNDLNLTEIISDSVNASKSTITADFQDTRTDLKVVIESNEDLNVTAVAANEIENIENIKSFDKEVCCNKTLECNVTSDNKLEDTVTSVNDQLNELNIHIDQSRSTDELTSDVIHSNDETSVIIEMSNKPLIDNNACEDEANIYDNPKESLLSDKSSIGNSDSSKSSDVINSFHNLAWRKATEMGRNQKPTLQTLQKKEERNTDLVEGTKKKKNNKKRNEKSKTIETPESETASGTEKNLTSQQPTVWKEDSSKELFPNPHADLELKEQQELELAVAASLEIEAARALQMQDTTDENMSKKSNSESDEWHTVQRNGQSREASKSVNNHPPGVAVDSSARPIHGRTGKEELHRKPGFNQSSNDYKKGVVPAQNQSNQMGSEGKINPDLNQGNNRQNARRNQDSYRDQNFNRHDEYNRYQRNSYNKDQDHDYRQDGQQNRYGNRDQDRNYRQDGQQNKYGNRNQDRDYRQDGQYGRYNNRDSDRYDNRQNYADGKQQNYSDPRQQNYPDARQQNYSDPRQQNYSNRSEQANSRDNSTRRDSMKRNQDDDRIRSLSSTGKNDDYPNRNSNYPDKGRDGYKNQDQRRREDYYNKNQDTRNKNQDSNRNYNDKQRTSSANVGQNEENWDEEPAKSIATPQSSSSTSIQQESNLKDGGLQLSEANKAKRPENQQNSKKPETEKNSQSDHASLPLPFDANAENAALSSHPDIQFGNVSLSPRANMNVGLPSHANMEVGNPSTINEPTNLRSKDSTLSVEVIESVEHLQISDQYVMNQELNEKKMIHSPQGSCRSSPSPIIKLTLYSNDHEDALKNQTIHRKDHEAALMNHLQENVYYSPPHSVPTDESCQDIQQSSGLNSKSPKYRPVEIQQMLLSDYVDNETLPKNDLNPDAATFDLPDNSQIHVNPRVGQRLDAGVASFIASGAPTTEISPATLFNGNYFTIAGYLLPKYHEKWGEMLELRKRLIKIYGDLACVQGEMLTFETNLLKSLEEPKQMQDSPMLATNATMNPPINPRMNVTAGSQHMRAPVLPHPSGNHPYQHPSGNHPYQHPSGHHQYQHYVNQGIMKTPAQTMVTRPIIMQSVAKNQTSNAAAVGTAEVLNPSIASYQAYNQITDLNHTFNQSNPPNRVMTANVGGVNQAVNAGHQRRFSGTEYVSEKVPVPPGFRAPVQSMQCNVQCSGDGCMIVNPEATDLEYAVNSQDPRYRQVQVQQRSEMQIINQPAMYYTQNPAASYPQRLALVVQDRVEPINLPRERASVINTHYNPNQPINQ